MGQLLPPAPQQTALLFDTFISGWKAALQV
jgi:hypothetical protein